VRHTSRSSGFLGVEASLARVFQSGMKTGGGATTRQCCYFLLHFSCSSSHRGPVFLLIGLPAKTPVDSFVHAARRSRLKICLPLDFLRGAPSVVFCSRAIPLRCVRRQASAPAQFFCVCSCVDCCRNLSRSILESSDQKTRGFVVQITLPRWFLEHVHQVFGEILVRI
jgi:hypothetical protein